MSQVLADTIIQLKYSRYLAEKGRRELWHEIVDRNKAMHVKRFPQLVDEIERAYAWVYSRKVLPSMRSLQFGGTAIEANNVRMYNCAYLPVSESIAFAEAVFLLLSGSGVGYSVQKQHVAQLPCVQAPNGSQCHVIGDSIEGWADAVKALFAAYLESAPLPEFDFSAIRPQGAPLKTAGGKAPGPEPLRAALKAVGSLLAAKQLGEQLTPLECHDVMCHLAECVLAGGVRRSSLLALFSKDDQAMLTCKSGEWWKANPQRARANNSVAILRSEVTETEFKALWRQVEESGAGEPGIYFTNDLDWGVNPCCEIALRPYQFCNLCELNVSDVTSQEDLEQRVRVGALLGTLQASYTDFPYLRPIWKQTTDKDALLGIGMTGIASGAVLPLDLKQAARVALEENARIAVLIGVNQAARVTTCKPSGTSSLVLGCSSGIHSWHGEQYIRNIRVGKQEPFYDYMSKLAPRLVADDQTNAAMSVISFPIVAPPNSIYRSESALQLLERVRRFNEEWIAEGHRDGANRHNVSATVSIKPDEWTSVGDWMWAHRSSFNGLAVLPYDGGSYVQAPHQDCEPELIAELTPLLAGFNIADVSEDEDRSDFLAVAACSGDKCERL